MKRPDHLEQVKKRLLDAKDGAVFIPSDFFDIAEASKINKCLTRLTQTTKTSSSIYHTNPRSSSRRLKLWAKATSPIRNFVASLSY